MKYIFLVVALFTLQGTFAQTPEPCGTHISHEWMDAFYQRDVSHLESHSRGALPEVIVPIIYHLVGDDNGNGYYEMTDLLRLHCDFQAAFDPANMQFYILDIKTINSTSFYEGNSTSQLFNQYNDRDVLNVFIVDDMSGVCGYSYVPQNHTGSGWSGPNRGGIMLQKGCLEVGSTTYIHEGGHYFNLPHTFYGWEGEDAPSFGTAAPNSIGGVNVERVSGVGCTSSGDGFCDTPPDYISERWSCNNTVNLTDPDDVDFAVDETNYMSYSSDVCTDFFSADQFAEMNNTPSTHRSYLMNLTPPVITPLALVSETTPNNQDYVSSTAGVTLKWNAVQGADFYLLQVATGNFFNPLVEEVLTDTSYAITNLLLDRDYEWRVKPYNFNYVCTDYSDIARFSTAAFLVDVNVGDLNCPEVNTGTASLAVPSGNYNVIWNSDDPIVNSQLSGVNGLVVNNLSGGAYTATVINSATNDTAIVLFDVESPNPIEIVFSQVGSTIEADVTGGQQPYTIIWGNSEVGEVNNSPTEGINTVLLVDANGCQKNAEFVFGAGSVGINDLNGNISAVNIFPNPTIGTSASISIESQIKGYAGIKLYRTNGQLVSSSNASISTGNNELTLALPNLSNGIYFVQIELEGSTYTERVVVLN